MVYRIRDLEGRVRLWTWLRATIKYVGSNFRNNNRKRFIDQGNPNRCAFAVSAFTIRRYYGMWMRFCAFCAMKKIVSERECALRGRCSYGRRQPSKLAPFISRLFLSSSRCLVLLPLSPAGAPCQDGLPGHSLRDVVATPVSRTLFNCRINK